MLYHLFTYLDQIWDLPGAGLFQYISFRAAMAVRVNHSRFHHYPVDSLCGFMQYLHANDAAGDPVARRHWFRR